MVRALRQQPGPGQNWLGVSDMSTLARYNGIEVQIKGVLHTGDGRKRVAIRAIQGELFGSWTHGGWITTDSAVVSSDVLSDFRQDGRPLRRSQAIGASTRNAGPEPGRFVSSPHPPLRSQPWRTQQRLRKR